MTYSIILKGNTNQEQIKSLELKIEKRIEILKGWEQFRAEAIQRGDKNNSYDMMRSKREMKKSTQLLASMKSNLKRLTNA